MNLCLIKVKWRNQSELRIIWLNLDCFIVDTQQFAQI